MIAMRCIYFHIAYKYYHLTLLCITKGNNLTVTTPPPSPSRVMAAGSSRPWDQLLSETTQLPPSAAPLVAFFQPLQKLTAEASETRRVLRTMELEGQSGFRWGGRGRRDGVKWCWKVHRTQIREWGNLVALNDDLCLI